jgi:hypothetical protein
MPNKNNKKKDTESPNAIDHPCTDFATQFRNFLADPKNQPLLRSSICGELISEIHLLKAAINERDAVIKRLEDRVEVLENQTDDLEQYSRRNCLRLNGLPEVSGEDTDCKTLEVLNKNLNLWPPLDKSHVDRIHRIGDPNKERKNPRQVIIKFTSYRHRQRVLQRKRGLKGTGLFLNEDLTKKRSAIMWTARNMWKDRRFKDVWTSDGRILVRDWAGKVHSINSAQDLHLVPAIQPPPLPPPLLSQSETAPKQLVAFEDTSTATTDAAENLLTSPGDP